MFSSSSGSITISNDWRVFSTEAPSVQTPSVTAAAIVLSDAIGALFVFVTIMTNSAGVWAKVSAAVNKTVFEEGLSPTNFSSDGVQVRTPEEESKSAPTGNSVMFNVGVADPASGSLKRLARLRERVSS